MSDSSESPWIATDDHDDAFIQDERRRHTLSQPSDSNTNALPEPVATSNSALNFSASSIVTPSGRPSSVVSFTPSPTGISFDTSSAPPDSTPQVAQWSADSQRYPQSPLPGADSSSSEHELSSRASPKRRLSYDEIMAREQRGDLMASSLRSRRSARTIGLASRRSSFTPDRPVNLHPSTSLRTGRSLGAASSSTYVSVPNTQGNASPIISPPPNFATSVLLRQQQLTVEAGTSAAVLRAAAPLVPEVRAVNDFEEELRFLRDQWTSVCITLSSLRNMYLAVASSSSSITDTASAPQEGSLTAAVAGSSSGTSSVQQVTDFPVPSSISVASFVGMAPPNRSIRSSRTQRRGRRSNRRDRGRTTDEQTQGERHYGGIHPDVQHEMLIGYDDAMLQIRQLEFKVEALEAEIRRLVEESSDPLGPS